MAKSVSNTGTHRPPPAASGCPPSSSSLLTFVHITKSERDPSPILEVRAFGEFQAGIRERCDEPPVAQAFAEVGSYRFLGG